MKISIIVPVYNVENYVSRCIDSLLAGIGNKKNIELIIVDDGSTDGSGNIVDKYKDNSMINVMHKKNGGLSDARNYGLNKANGDYIIFVDSDDEIDPSNFEKVYDSINKSNSDVILWDSKIIDEFGKNISNKDSDYYIHHGLDCSKIYSGIEVIEKQLQDHADFVTTVWLGAYKRSFLINNQLYFEKNLLHEDELWTTKLFLIASSVEYLESDVYLYRIRNNSIMNKANKKFDRNIKDIIFIYSFLFTYIDWRCFDKTFSKKLKGNIARRYLHSLYKFEIYKNKNLVKRIKKIELFKNSNRFVDKCRCIVLFISPYLFCKL